MGIMKSVYLVKGGGDFSPALAPDKLISLNIVNKYLSCEEGRGYLISYFFISMIKQHDHGNLS